MHRRQGSMRDLSQKSETSCLFMFKLSRVHMQRGSGLILDRDLYALCLLDKCQGYDDCE